MNCVLSFLVNLILFPFYLVFGLLFLVLWGLLTITGIGPLIQYCLSSRDAKLVDRNEIVSMHSDIRILTVPGHVNSASGGAPYKLVARYSEPANFDNTLPPVAFPNGLGATLVLTSRWHEELLRRGYRVLSFDRLGVGFSEDNPTGTPPSAPDVIREMDFVLNSFQSASTKWILVGGSMGSIVAQCYISAFPQKVAGFLNMDGLPYPFIVAKKNFEFAAWLYKVYTYVIWTGLFRPFISLGLKPLENKIESDAFPISISYAQANQTRFFGNIGLEMLTMMELCEFGTVAWGVQDINKLEVHILDSLVRSEPDESIEFVENQGGNSERRPTTFRSPSERGSEWASAGATSSAVEKLKQLRDEQGMEFADIIDSPVELNATSSESIAIVPARIVSVPNLPHVWKDLVVRVMSGRNHDFGSEAANKFYTSEMKDLAAAEHTVHAKLAADGRRLVYPKSSHMQMFMQTAEVCTQVDDIVAALKRLSASNQV